MPLLVSAPLPELDWPTLTVISVDAGDPGAVVESLIILVSEDAPGLPDNFPILDPLLAYGPDATGNV